MASASPSPNYNQHYTGYTPPQYQYGGYVPTAPHTRAASATSGYAAPGYNGSISSVSSSSITSGSTVGVVTGAEGVGQGERDLTRVQGDVPGAVRNLLLSIKQLQEALTSWSLGKASELEVSDVYVQFGEDLNSAIQAFAYHRIDLSEVLSIPKDLRTVLEQCLSEEASPEALEQFMPQVRQILFSLLMGLRDRKDAWKSVSVGGTVVGGGTMIGGGTMVGGGGGRNGLPNPYVQGYGAYTGGVAI